MSGITDQANCGIWVEEKFEDFDICYSRFLSDEKVFSLDVRVGRRREDKKYFEPLFAMGIDRKLVNIKMPFFEFDDMKDLAVLNKCINHILKVICVREFAR